MATQQSTDLMRRRRCADAPEMGKTALENTSIPRPNGGMREMPGSRQRSAIPGSWPSGCRRSRYGAFRKPWHSCADR
jgi:hypothetical protein